MKKPHRNARKGDTAPKSTQSKQTSTPDETLVLRQRPDRQPAGFGNEIAEFDDQRLFRNGNVYFLVTDYGEMDVEKVRAPGQTVQQLTRKQARTWLDETVIHAFIPQEFRRDFRSRACTRHSAESLTLGEMLGRDSINELADLDGQGVPLSAQVAGAVKSWLSYVRYMKEQLPDLPERWKAAPGILDCEHFDYVQSQERSQFLSRGGARLFRSLTERIPQMPTKEAAEFANGLADLIEYHPGLADEYKALSEFSNAQCSIGLSGAVSSALGRRKLLPEYRERRGAERCPGAFRLCPCIRQFRASAQAVQTRRVALVCNFQNAATFRLPTFLHTS